MGNKELEGVAASPPGHRCFAVEPASAVSSKAGTPNAMTDGPWDWEASKTFSANGGFHLYLIDSTGRKIAALWGKEEEKIANARAMSSLHDLLASLEFIAGHDAAANGLTGFAADLVSQLTSEAQRALSLIQGEQA